MTNGVGSNLSGSWFLISPVGDFLDTGKIEEFFEVRKVNLK
jgi:hypothetical protein